ncbi:GTP1/OBG family protein [Tieghemostelium lacteum]|uniref:GTP1/OBG family protein n=1 Tax=Tieghemostelium lacteum TaxID=361077 RepID=A0A151ZIQ3_TIELA|nr:GTP1/OBG family protein [Tieghemostelium lacteum]|eukprot:KYQ93836.1 GTP1/OBG family protein [Tieghemostelium lacteum]
MIRLIKVNYGSTGINKNILGFLKNRHYSTKNVATSIVSDEFKKMDLMSVEELRDVAESMGSTTPFKNIDYAYNQSMFTDRVRMKLQAGNGGNGSVHFFRAKYIPLGPPDGGPGGDGADIIIRADYNDNNLSHLSRNYKGEHGGNGLGQKKSGKNGEDIVISVPPGTVIRELQLIQEDGEVEEEEEEGIIMKKDSRFDPSSKDFDVDLYAKALNSPVIGGVVQDEMNVHYNKGGNLSQEIKAEKQKKWKIVKTIVDLDNFGDEILIAKGGKGGRGNASYATGSNRSPEYAQKGIPGEIRNVEVELKILADFGLVGYPNAGKSTLLSVISNAIPKIRDYAFTTLNPYVGVIEFEDLNKKSKKSKLENLSKRKRKVATEFDSLTATIADLPGIIEGAHLDVGLGLDFLKHIERTKVLVYVIDMSNNGVPAFWDGKPLEIVSNRYSYVSDEDEIKQVKMEIKDKIYDESYRSPWRDFVSLLEELESYQEGLTSKPSIIIANKMDKDYAHEHLKIFKKAVGKLVQCPIIPISAQNSTNIKEIKLQLSKIIYKDSL